MAFRDRNIKYSSAYQLEFPWVAESTAKGVKYAFCTMCKKDIRIDSMGKASLTSHSNSQKHKNVKKILESNSTLPMHCEKEENKLKKANSPSQKG